MQQYVWDSWIPLSQARRYAMYEPARRQRRSDTVASCQHCGVEFGFREWTGEFVAKICGKYPLGDVCSDRWDLLLSHKSQKVIASHSLTGISFPHTPIEFISHPEIREYRVCHIADVVQSLDSQQSGLIPKQMFGCSLCMLCSRSRLDRIVFKEPLSELDAFRPSCLHGVTIVSENFVAAVRSQELTNFIFLPLEEYFEPRSYTR